MFQKTKRLLKAWDLNLLLFLHKSRFIQPAHQLFPAPLRVAGITGHLMPRQIRRPPEAVAGQHATVLDFGADHLAMGGAHGRGRW